MLAGMRLTDGTAAEPHISFASDTDSGFYRIGSDNVGLTLGGTKRWDFGTAGSTLTGTLTVSGAVALQSTLAVTGAATLSSTLAVTGVATFSAAPVVSMASPYVSLFTTAVREWRVGMDTSTFRIRDESGATDRIRISTAGAITLTGTLSVSSTLAVTGAATLSSTLAVTGNTTVGGTLGVTGATTLSTLSASGQITSTVATGTAPLVIASTTVVPNLNADKVDGKDAATIITEAQTGIPFSGALVRGGASALVGGAKAIWTAEEIDVGGYWSSGAPTRLTAPADGYYHFDAYYDTNNAGTQLTLYKNGSATNRAATNQGDDGILLSGIIQLAAGDYLEVQGNENATGSGSWFSIHWIGAS